MKIKLLKFKKVNSTNETAMELLSKKKTNATLILAEIQNKGKGTMGKKWISLKGNIFISIFFEITRNKINFKQFAILNALLIKKIIKDFTKIKVKVKWPNDLLFDNKKICGILQEVINLQKKKFIIIGIGINTNAYPKKTTLYATSLKNILKKDIDNKKLLNNLKRSYEIFLDKTKIFTFSELKEIYK